MFPKNYTKTEEHFTVRNFYGRPSLTTAFRAQYDWYVQSKSSFRNCLFVQRYMKQNSSHVPKASVPHFCFWYHYICVSLLSLTFFITFEAALRKICVHLRLLQQWLYYGRLCQPVPVVWVSNHVWVLIARQLLSSPWCLHALEKSGPNFRRTLSVLHVQ